MLESQNHVMTSAEFNQTLAKLKELNCQYVREATKTLVMIAKAKQEGLKPSIS